MPTTIDFHFNVPDRLVYACRLLRKATANGYTLAVVGDETVLTQIDAQLWSFSALDFIPHARFDALTDTQRSCTPIWLCQSAQQGRGRELLLNLFHVVPEGLDAFDRVLEVISEDEADKQGARLRWKHYAQCGFAITSHDFHAQA
jgi:DNA polymerase III subunit chi